MRKLLDDTIDYGFVAIKDTVRSVCITKATMTTGDDVDFSFKVDKDPLFTHAEIQASGVPRIAVDIFVVLDKESSVVYQNNIQALSKLHDVVEYEAQQKLIMSNLHKIGQRANYEYVNTTTHIIPHGVDLHSMVRDYIYKMCAFSSQQFPLGFNLDRYHKDLQPMLDKLGDTDEC